MKVSSAGFYLRAFDPQLAALFGEDMETRWKKYVPGAGSDLYTHTVLEG